MSHSNHQKDNENKIKSNQFPHPLETKQPINEETKEEQKQKPQNKNSLLFEQKDISVIKLYCHLSEKLEILFMILGFIGSICSGASGPIISLLNGSTVNNFRDSTILNTPNSIMMEEFKKEIDKKVRIYLIMGVAMFLSHFLMTFMWALSALRQMHHLKEKYFATILKQEQGWFDENNAYEFSTKVQAQLEQIELGVGDKFGVLIQLISQVITGLIVSFITSWKLTLVMLVVIPFTILSFLIMMKTLKSSIILSRKTYEKAGGVAEEILYNIKTVSSFVNFDFEMERFGTLIDEVHRYNVDKAYKLGRTVGISVFLNHSSFAIAILYGKKLIIDQEISSRTGKPFTVGDILVAVYSTLLVIMSFNSIAPNIKIIQESALASSDYFTLYERKPKINLRESTLKPSKDEILGKVEFKNVSFIYPSDKNKRKILDNLNMTFEPGKKIALVGESGCGKSTIVNLIERLYEPTEGIISIDGIQIDKYDIEYLRTIIGYVQQEPVLFNQTIMDNVIFGRENIIKELGDKDTLVKNACHDSHATEFINKNPDKYNYIVGIKESKLSGGQKQRIAIARAILCQPKILILDEATSAFDNKSEKEVQIALDNISKKYNNNNYST
jgi:ATP-binding cassette subfamily B (MDR/TAP) protein 1